MPYSGKVSIDGINYHGSANFSFSLLDGNGTTHWQNGVDANESIRVFVVNGRYSVMLGGQGMNPLPPELFLQHEELYLSVSFDKGDGPRSLGPDQLITATPRALVAEVAKVAKVAEKLSGEITSDMLSPEVLSKLDANQSTAPMGPITLDMLPAEVLADLNKSTPAITSITRDMLPADVLADLNRTVAPQTIQPSSITANQMAQNTITTAQLNEQILKYLKPEITHTPQAPGLVFGGQTVTLLSQAEGKFLTYQWNRNGQPIAGATSKSFSISEVNGTLHDGNYTVVVSNDFGSVTSAPTLLQVDGYPSTHSVASISMEMIFCPPGTFTMGSPSSEAGRGGDETQHQVTLTNGFYLGKYEVTQAQYQTIMNGNPAGLNADPSQFKGSNRPVERVSWEDAQVFLYQLNAIEQSAGRLPAGWKYVLPTEAEWEYACRAGTTTAYSWGNDINASRANYNWDGGPNDGNDSQQTVEIGQFSANPWGFYDMHGNVWEWVQDWKANYLTGAQTDPEGPASGSHRVLRGGSWHAGGALLRSALRNQSLPSRRDNGIGFRVGFQAVQPDEANPEIILAGSTAVTHSQGLPFIDPGVEAHDVRDGNITDQIVVTGTVDMNNTGTYLLTYTVQDGAGNSATATRTVTVAGNRTVDLNATVAMDMIWCPPGTFTMGSPTTEAGREADREDEHNVTLTKGFYLGKYEVTQAQYKAVMTGNTDS